MALTLRDEALTHPHVPFNFIIGIHERTGIDVPEEDYPLLASLDGCIAYLVKAGNR